MAENFIPGDLFEEAVTEQVQNNDWWGQANVCVWEGQFPGPVVWTKGNDPAKRNVITDIKFGLIPQCAQMQYTDIRGYRFSQNWVKVTAPSIRDCGLVTPGGAPDLRALDGKWCHVTKVDGLEKNKKEPDKPNYKTPKFVKIFKSEAECLADYDAVIAGMAQEAPTTSAPQQQTSAGGLSQNQFRAIGFVKTAIKDAYAAKKSGDEVKQIVEKFIAENAQWMEGLTINSPEITALLNEPPF